MRLRRTLCSGFAATLSALCIAAGAQAATRPLVTAELDRLVAEGAVAPAAAGADRAVYDDARVKLKRLTGARKVQLGGVVADLEGMAARGQFIPSRLPALFLTLQRNVQWWTTSP